MINEHAVFVKQLMDFRHDSFSQFNFVEHVEHQHSVKYLVGKPVELSVPNTRLKSELIDKPIKFS